MQKLRKSNEKIRIMVLTGQHPKECTGGAELQAYYIAQNIHKLGTKIVFCTWSSDSSGTTIEDDGLIHLRISQNYSFIKKIKLLFISLTQYEVNKGFLVAYYEELC